MEKENSLNYEIRVLFNLIRHKLNESDKLQCIGGIVTHREGAVIEIMNTLDGPVFQKDIEKYLKIRKSTATIMLQEMEKKDLIKKEPVDNDFRLKKLVLTEKALEISKTIRTEFEIVEGTLLKGFSNKEKQDLFGFLDRIKENLLDNKN